MPSFAENNRIVELYQSFIMFIAFSLEAKWREKVLTSMKWKE